MFIISKYCYETREINILHVEDDYEDAVHHCMDHILDDIKQYKQEGDQIIINSQTDIIVYRRGVWSKFHLYHYLIHEYDDEEESAEGMKD